MIFEKINFEQKYVKFREEFDIAGIFKCYINPEMPLYNNWVNPFFELDDRNNILYMLRCCDQNRIAASLSQIKPENYGGKYLYYFGGELIWLLHEDPKKIAA